ncbi:MAG: hypothetical protein AMXMBFR84_40240 [Candidatus Hydrogenedentota bacterium]
MHIYESRPQGGRLAVLGTAAWAAVTLAGLDILIAYLRDRESFVDPIAILQSMAATSIAVTGLILLTGTILRLAGRKPDGWALALGVCASGIVFLAIAEPRHLVEEVGRPVMRLCVGIPFAVACGALAALGAARLSETTRNGRWLRAAMALAATSANWLTAWNWAAGMYEAFDISFALHTQMLAAALGMSVVAAAICAAIKIDRIAFLAGWAGLVFAPLAIHYGYVPHSPPIQGETPGPKHVFLIVVDTLRGDVPSYTGSSAVQTPHMDALAADSVVFTDAISPAPWTLPAITSLFSGVSPLVHHTIKRFSTVPNELTLIAERMRDAGYNTAAVGKNPVLGLHSNIQQGIARYEWFSDSSGGGSWGWLLRSSLSRQGTGEFSTTSLVDVAIERTAGFKDVPTFLWLHIFDPHLPYHPPAQFVNGQPPADSLTKDVLSIDDLHRIRMGIYVPTSKEQQWIRELYNAEVRYVDQELGRFIDHLKSQGIYDDALIIMTSDHGEEFWEHSGFEHGHTLYNELLHVPLLVKLPGKSTAKTIVHPVTTMAIAATIADIAALGTDPSEFDAASLRPLWEEGPTPLAPIYSTGLLYYFDGESLVFDGMKYVLTFVDGQKKLFDRAADPGEKIDVSNDQHEKSAAAAVIIDEKRRRADDKRNGMGLPLVPGTSQPLSPEAQKALESIGYL